MEKFMIFPHQDVIWAWSFVAWTNENFHVEISEWSEMQSEIHEKFSVENHIKRW